MWDWLFTGLELSAEIALAAQGEKLEPNHKLEEQILYVLLQGEMTGQQITEAIKQEFMYQPRYDPIYLALQHLEKQGLVTSRWSNVRGVALRRYYRCTNLQRAHLETR